MLTNATDTIALQKQTIDEQIAFLFFQNRRVYKDSTDQIVQRP